MGWPIGFGSIGGGGSSGSIGGSIGGGITESSTARQG
jgi:hypothetical protein